MGRPKGKPRTKAEKSADAKRTGRPTLSALKKNSKAVTMRLPPEYFTIFQKDAKQLKLGLAAFMRYCWRIAKENNYGENIPKRKKTK